MFVHSFICKVCTQKYINYDVISTINHCTAATFKFKLKWSMKIKATFKQIRYVTPNCILKWISSYLAIYLLSLVNYIPIYRKFHEKYAFEKIEKFAHNLNLLSWEVVQIPNEDPIFLASQKRFSRESFFLNDQKYPDSWGSIIIEFRQGKLRLGLLFDSSWL